MIGLSMGHKKNVDLIKKSVVKRQEHIKKQQKRQKIIQKMLEDHASDILESDNFKSTKQHIQHGTVTVHKHCMDVAECSLLLNKKMGLKCNQHDLIRGALLHDYFLYDWHDKEYLSQRKRLHGFWHPGIALKNAEKEYELNDTQKEIIRKHMWPLTVVPPTCREAWVVTAADKYCSLMETVRLHKGNGKKNTNTRKNNGGTSLFTALSEYGSSDYYPYHMPGHKRSSLARDMARYYGIDITEIDGFDNLHHAEGILRDAQLRANRLYGADETFYLVNGSTCGVLTSIMAATERGGELLIARNCHKSVYHAAILQELTLHYYYPPLLKEYGICDGVSAEDVKKLLNEYPDCCAVVITSPTYEGVVSDIKAIADAVHAQDKILIVDEAHGAHFGLDKHMPANAVACGADLVIHSLHKTLPSMTQTALLHVQGQRVNRRKLQEYLRMLQTSSPSYVMMASIDSCIRYLEKHSTERFASMRRQYEIFCKKVESCKYISIGKMTDVSEKGYNLTDWDIGKLVIFVRHTAMNGWELYDILRKEFHLQMEMAAPNYVLAIMTITDTEEGWQRLADALLAVDGKIEKENCVADKTVRTSTVEASIGYVQAEDVSADDGYIPKNVRGAGLEPTSAALTIADAFHSEREEIPLADAEGRIAADFVNLYPPGVPMLVPGETIDRAIINRIGEYLHSNLCLQGITAEGKIYVVL